MNYFLKRPKRKTIGFTHKFYRIGGPTSFKSKFENYFNQIGYEFIYPWKAEIPEILFIINGSRKIFWILLCKLLGSKIVLRLDGIEPSVKTYFFSRNFYLTLKNKLILALNIIIRNYLADGIVYQSEYLKHAWNENFRIIKTKDIIIYNSFDLKKVCNNKKNKILKLLCVEGNIPFENAYLEPVVKVSEYLQSKNLITETVVIGNINNQAKEYLIKKNKNIQVKGEIPHYDVLKYYPGSLYLVMEVNPACPNSVIEALANSVPIIGFKTGSLTEMLNNECSYLVDYNRDIKKLEVPDTRELLLAAENVIKNYDQYSKSARKLAEKKYALAKMGKEYLNLFNNLLQAKN